MSARSFVRLVAAAMVAVSLSPEVASAQQRTAVRGFGDFGATLFSAGDTFDAVVGSSTGTFFGGGVEVVLPQRYFFNLRISRFNKSGERVFVQDNEVFPLGIDMKVTITPVEVTGGYRFQPQGQTGKFIPYVGGGIGWYRYAETSDFAETGEDVSETFQGYHLLGGVEVRLNQWLALGGEGQWTTVPDAFEPEPGSAADVFGETNLGGLGFRVRFTVGR